MKALLHDLRNTLRSILKNLQQSWRIILFSWIFVPVRFWLLIFAVVLLYVSSHIILIADYIGFPTSFIRRLRIPWSWSLKCMLYILGFDVKVRGQRDLLSQIVVTSQDCVPGILFCLSRHLSWICPIDYHRIPFISRILTPVLAANQAIVCSNITKGRRALVKIIQERARADPLLPRPTLFNLNKITSPCKFTDDKPSIHEEPLWRGLCGEIGYASAYGTLDPFLSSPDRLMSTAPPIFHAAVPVQPLAFIFSKPQLTLTHSYSKWEWCWYIFELLASPSQSVEVHWLSTYVPDAREKVSASFFTTNVWQLLMKDLLAHPCGMSTFATTPLAKFPNIIDTSLEDIKAISRAGLGRQLKAFYDVDTDKDGYIDVTQFARMHEMPCTPFVMNLFHSFRAHAPPPLPSPASTNHLQELAMLSRYVSAYSTSSSSSSSSYGHGPGSGQAPAPSFSSSPFPLPDNMLSFPCFVSHLAWSLIHGLSSAPKQSFDFVFDILSTEAPLPSLESGDVLCMCEICRTQHMESDEVTDSDPMSQDSVSPLSSASVSPSPRKTTFVTPNSLGIPSGSGGSCDTSGVIDAMELVRETDVLNRTRLRHTTHPSPSPHPSSPHHTHSTDSAMAVPAMATEDVEGEVLERSREWDQPATMDTILDDDAMEDDAPPQSPFLTHKHTQPHSSLDSQVQGDRADSNDSDIDSDGLRRQPSSTGGTHSVDTLPHTHTPSMTNMCDSGAGCASMPSSTPSGTSEGSGRVQARGLTRRASRMSRVITKESLYQGLRKVFPSISRPESDGIFIHVAACTTATIVQKDRYLQYAMEHPHFIRLIAIKGGYDSNCYETLRHVMACTAGAPSPPPHHQSLLSTHHHTARLNRAAIAIPPSLAAIAFTDVQHQQHPAPYEKSGGSFNGVSFNSRSDSTSSLGSEAGFGQAQPLPDSIPTTAATASATASRMPRTSSLYSFKDNR